MGFCANCGQPRSGNTRFCGTCGTEFTDSPAAPGEQAPGATGWAAQAGDTRTDISAGNTRIDPPGSPGGQASQPDPFASWYSPAQPATAPEPPRGRPDMYWQQPTETVRPAQQAPGGYSPPTAQGGYPTAPAPMYGAPYPPGPGGGPPQGGGRGRTGLLVVLAIVVVLAAGGGAYALATRLGKHAAAGPSSPASSSAPGSPSSATQPATGTKSGSTSQTAPASHPGSATSPSSNLVAIGSGVSGAAVPAARELLTKRFQGINTHNYAEYASTLTAHEQANQPQSNFESGYRSTSDSGITLTALKPTSGGFFATVAFTSHQDPADSGDGSACNTWTSTYYLVPSGSGYLIDTAPAGTPAPDRGDC